MSLAKVRPKPPMFYTQQIKAEDLRCETSHVYLKKQGFCGLFRKRGLPLEFFWRLYLTLEIINVNYSPRPFCYVSNDRGFDS